MRIYPLSIANNKHSEFWNCSIIVYIHSTLKVTVKFQHRALPQLTYKVNECMKTRQAKFMRLYWRVGDHTITLSQV